MSTKLRFGVVGCGWIANMKHMPTISRCPDAELVAFCDIDGDRAAGGRDRFGAPGARVYTDYNELVSSPDVDVVHVLTPNNFHAPVSVAALKAGKHVFCEKPMAATEADCRAMIEAQRASGKKLSFGFQYRLRPENLYLKGLIENGALGDIYFMKAHSLRRRGVPGWGAYLSREKNGGGVLVDGGPHSIDLALWLTGNYRPVSVRGSTYLKLHETEQVTGGIFDAAFDPRDFTVEDAAFGFVTFENGATMIVESSWALNVLDPDDQKVTLCGTKMGADMHDATGLRLNSVMAGKLTTIVPELNYGLSRDPMYLSSKELELWMDAVRRDVEPFVTPEQALVVTRIIESVYLSAEKNETVFLKY